MSLKAMTWAFENSPYAQGARLVHLVLADKANDDHDYELWMKQADIARMANLSVVQVARILKQMVADGTLELLEAGRGRGNPSRYRLVVKTPQNDGFSESTENPSKPLIPPTINPPPVRGFAKHTVSSNESRHKGGKTLISDDFIPSPRVREWAAEKHPTVDLDRELERFINYHAGKGNRMVDWQRALMNWIINAEEWPSRSNGHRVLAPNSSWMDRSTGEGEP